ncbi:hypothetical protein VTI74DRAFT_1787 [Chaetomium olivicolor]
MARVLGRQANNYFHHSSLVGWAAASPPHSGILSGKICGIDKKSGSRHIASLVGQRGSERVWVRVQQVSRWSPRDVRKAWSEKMANLGQP